MKAITLSLENSFLKWNMQEEDNNVQHMPLVDLKSLSFVENNGHYQKWILVSSKQALLRKKQCKTEGWCFYRTKNSLLSYGSGF